MGAPRIFFGERTGLRMRTRIFIDYWNFQLAWNKRSSSRNKDWAAVPNKLVELAQNTLGTKLGQLQLEETLIYASYDTSHAGSGKFRHWLTNFLDRLPGVRVSAVERRWRERPVHCRKCNKSTSTCGFCQATLGRAAEKTVDARIVTDMMALAWEQVYEVAILVTSDGDFVPAVEKMQEKNIKVVNARWEGVGHRLSQICWASFPMDVEIPKLLRL